MVLGSHVLQLWDAANMIELVKEMLEARALKRVLYLLLVAQLGLYAVQHVERASFRARRWSGRARQACPVTWTRLALGCSPLSR